MKWDTVRIEELKELCYKNVSNAEIAARLGVPVSEIYAKRSHLGLTIAKCAEKTGAASSEADASKEKRLLKAIFSAPDTEIEDNYPETFIDKVCYSETILYHTLAELSPALQRLNRLHNLLAVSEKDGESKLPDIITNNESRMALEHLLQVQNDISEVCGYIEEIFKSTEVKDAKTN